jgi:hypothetical protein
VRRHALLLSSLVAAGAIAASGCAVTGGTPDASGLLSSSIRATAGQKDVKVHYAVTAKIDATPSASASAQTRKWLAEPITLTASGGASKDAFTLAGKVGFTGKTFAAQALVGQHQTFINLLGTWYGDRTKGIADAEHGATETTPKADPKQVRKALRWVYDHADEVLVAKVGPGPDIDGETWQAKGHCDADGVAKLAEAQGEPVSAEDRAGLATFCRVTELTFVAGAGDRLPRELRLTAHFDKATLARLANGGDDSTKELDRLDLELDVRLTQWGGNVHYEAPADVRPMDDLGMAVLGLLFQAAA